MSKKIYIVESKTKELYSDGWETNEQEHIERAFSNKAQAEECFNGLVNKTKEMYELQDEEFMDFDEFDYNAEFAWTAKEDYFHINGDDMMLKIWIREIELD